MFDVIGDAFGLVGEIGKFAARKSIGYGRESSSWGEAYKVALFAFQKYGKDRKNATRLMNDYEIKEYDELLKKYPGGYAEYVVERDKAAEESRLREEERWKKDPIGAYNAWIRNSHSNMKSDKADAEWNMAVDRDHGIYRPRSSYGL